MRSFVPILTLATATTLAACGRSPAAAPAEGTLRSDDSTAVVRSTYDGSAVELTVSVSRRAIAPGDTALLRMSIRNPSSVAVTLTLPSTCLFTWDVQDEVGRRPEVNLWGCGQAITTVKLAPGEERTASGAFTGQKLNYESGRGVFYTPLPAGTYYLAGGVSQAMSPRSPWLPVVVTAP